MTAVLSAMIAFMVFVLTGRRRRLAHRPRALELTAGDVAPAAPPWARDVPMPEPLERRGMQRVPANRGTSPQLAAVLEFGAPPREPRPFVRPPPTSTPGPGARRSD